MYLRTIMMTSSNGNIFHVTGSLCGEFTGHRWIPLTTVSDAKLWCFLWSAPAQTVWVNHRTPVIWNAISLILTSMWWSLIILQSRFLPALWMPLFFHKQIMLLIRGSHCLRRCHFHSHCYGHWQWPKGKSLLTHWPLGDVAAILKSVNFELMLNVDIFFTSSEIQSHITLLLINQHRLR